MAENNNQTAVEKEEQEMIEQIQTEPETGSKIQNRFRSWALWLAIAALITFCVKTFAHVDIDETVNGFMDVLLPVLVGFGIVNNPNSKDSF